MKPYRFFKERRRAWGASVFVASVASVGSSRAAIETDAWVTHVTATTAVVRVVGTQDSCSAQGAYSLSFGSSTRAPDECTALSGDHIVLTWALSGLSENTAYSATVRSETRSRHVFWKQAAPKGTDVSFVLAGDTQGFLQSNLVSAIWERAGKPNYLRDRYRFLLHTGDFANFESGDFDSNGGNQEWFVDKLNDFLNPFYYSIFGDLPFYVTPGGHDQLYGLNYSGDLRGFLKIWGHNPTFRHDKVGLGYSFKQGPVTFIVVNAMNLNGRRPESCKDNYFGPCMPIPPGPDPLPNDGSIADDGYSETYLWLWNELASAERDRKNRPFIVVSAHHPWSSSGWSHGAGVRPAKYRNAIKSLLRAYSVDAFFAGHTHNIEFGHIGGDATDTWKTAQIISGAANSQDSETRDTWDGWERDAHFDKTAAPPVQVYFPSKYYDASSAFVEAETDSWQGALRFRAIAYEPSYSFTNRRPWEPQMTALISGSERSVDNQFVQFARVPRWLTRKTESGVWHIYGPYRNNQASVAGAQERYFRVTLAATAPGAELHVKRLTRPGTGATSDCHRLSSGENQACSVDLTRDGSFWVGVRSEYSGVDYSLAVESRNTMPY